MVKVTFTSKKGRAAKEKIKEKLLADHLEEITADGFDPKQFDYTKLQKSDSDWDKWFEKKQFRETIMNLIKGLIKAHGKAVEEEEELFGAPAGFADETAEAMADLSLEEDPRSVVFPKNVGEFGDPRTDDRYFQALVQIPHGEWQVKIDTETDEAVVRVMADRALWDADAFEHYMDEMLQNRHAGLRLEAFGKCARKLIGEDEANPNLICYEERIKIPFKPEANFFTGAGGHGIFSKVTNTGNRVVLLQMIKERTNQHATNANVRHGAPNVQFQPNQFQHGAYTQQGAFHQPQQQPFNQQPSNQQGQYQQSFNQQPQQQFYHQYQNPAAQAASPMAYSPAPAPTTYPPGPAPTTYAPAPTTYAPAPTTYAPAPTTYGQPSEPKNGPPPAYTAARRQQRQQQQQQQQQFKKQPSTYVQGDWRQATGVAFAPGVDPNNLSFTPPPPQDDHNIPSVNLFPNTPQVNNKYKNQPVVETVTEEDEDEIEVEMGKPPADDGAQSDTNPQSGTWSVAEGISNFINRRSKRTPPSATSSTQEPYTKVQCASDSPESL